MGTDAGMNVHGSASCFVDSFTALIICIKQACACVKEKGYYSEYLLN